MNENTCNKAEFVTQILTSKDPAIKELLSSVEHMFGMPAQKVLLNMYVLNDDFKNNPLDEKFVAKNEFTNKSINGENNMNKTVYTGRDEMNKRIERLEQRVETYASGVHKQMNSVLDILNKINEVLTIHDENFKKIDSTNDDKITKEKLYMCWDGSDRSDAQIMICHSSESGDEAFKGCNGDDDGLHFDHYDEIPKRFYNYTSDKPQTGKIYFVWDDRKDEGLVMFCQGRFCGEYQFCDYRSEINDTDCGTTYKHIEPVRPELIGKVRK